MAVVAIFAGKRMCGCSGSWIVEDCYRMRNKERRGQRVDTVLRYLCSAERVDETVVSWLEKGKSETRV